MSPSRLCLGTAQLGLDYGIANANGKPSESDCDRLLSRAIERDVLRWDTARAYGDAEQRIGRFLAHCVHRDRIEIVSKLPSAPEGLETGQLRDWVSRQTEASLEALGIDQLTTWLVHSPDMLHRYGSALADSMFAQQQRGLALEIGASVYDPEEAERVLREGCYGAVQVPLNLLDARCLTSNVLQRCQARDISVYVRSVFLQGVFSLRPSSLPQELIRLQMPLTRLCDLLAKFGLSPMDIALSYAWHQPDVDYVIVGVDSARQLDQNLIMMDREIPAGMTDQLLTAFSDLDACVLEPRKWKTG